MPTAAIALATLTFYLFSASLWALNFMGKWRHHKIWLFLLGYGVVFAHAWLLHHWIDINGEQNLAFFNMLSLVIWLIALLVLLIALIKPIENLIIFIFPLAAISITLILLFPAYRMINTASYPMELIHILLAVLTAGVLCMAGLQALMLALLEGILRKKRSHYLLQKSPPLETMESLLFQIIFFGFVLLTFMMMTSGYFFRDLFVHSGFWSKIVFAVFTWMIFGGLLWGRYHWGWRGRKAIYGTLAGVVLIMFIYLGSVVLKEFIA